MTVVKFVTVLTVVTVVTLVKKVTKKNLQKNFFSSSIFFITNKEYTQKLNSRGLRSVFSHKSDFVNQEIGQLEL